MNTNQELWFVTGSQHLYGPETLAQVAADAQQVAEALNADRVIPVDVVWKPTVKTPDEVYAMCRDANADENCIGLITWMHTFSPAKMWIAGLTELKKPFVHLHTQFGRDIPWSEIDMDFMNLNQSAHGGREFGFICTRLRKNRTVVVGHWEDPEVREELGVWTRAARAWNESQGLKVARFGDNMREVAVTEGDKVEAQIQFGYSVNGYGMGDLKAYVDKVTDAQISDLVNQYRADYTIPADALMDNIAEQARIEIGMRTFLEEGGFGAFTTTFENLHGFKQLPGLAVQRLMADGYGFGAEGDWKTSAMLRIMKVMAQGLEGGTSFMEDYTYHFDPAGSKVLGSHMLEVCPSIAAGQPALETHPLGIGGKDDPARLVFSSPAGPAINVSPIDMGTRFRVVLNEVEAVVPEHDLPKLPVARALWIPQPNLKVGAAAWILAGGAHHSVYSQQVDTRHIEIFCEMANVELVVIDADTRLREFKRILKAGDLRLTC
ncbi:MAG: L-arabinose isomerase [Verrucomicrobia bacterium]|jgi:L-arabinose isomerase|nr:L-arabinose isomerase [Verrucomicrobiota bacterium]MBT7064884.1 L-arabinose isomerase [Verrucomicrobiota bacterium]MBT7702330.1 L-arabinose isomerase [Verrucomicrobiota bacterium]